MPGRRSCEDNSLTGTRPPVTGRMARRTGQVTVPCQSSLTESFAELVDRLDVAGGRGPIPTGRVPPRGGRVSSLKVRRHTPRGRLRPPAGSPRGGAEGA